MINGKALPIGWKLKTLGDLGAFLKGKGILKEELSATGLPCIRYGEIYTTHDLRIKRFQSFISKKVAMESERIYHNDILFAGSGETLEEIGKAVAYIGEEEAYAGGDVVILRTDKGADAEYLSYALNTDVANRQKRRLGQGHSVVHIYGRDLAELKLPIPPFSEQRKIARILYTWDRAIEKTEQLIAQKQQLKKGLMQLLLTGKVRFKEFRSSKKWKTTRLQEIMSCFSGGTPSRTNIEYYDGNIPWIKSGELNKTWIDDTEERISEKALKESSAKFVDKDTLLLALYGATAGVLAFTRIKAAINQAVLAIVPDESCDKLFLFYTLFQRMPVFLEQLLQGGQPNLSADIVKKMRINLPSDLCEQQRLGQLFLKLDMEIEAINYHVKFLKSQKNGLMQQLLTGNIRVKI